MLTSGGHTYKKLPVDNIAQFIQCFGESNWLATATLIIYCCCCILVDLVLHIGERLGVCQRLRCVLDGKEKSLCSLVEPCIVLTRNQER